MPTCRDCAVALDEQNWSEGQRKARTYVCRGCMSERGKAHYAAHRDRALQVRRERLRQPSKAREDAELKSQYYAANREKWKEYGARYKAKAAADPMLRAGRLLAWIRVRAARTDREFDLTREWIGERLQSGVCEVTGIALELSKPPGSRFHPWAPSVDRIDCKKGYTQDNCRVVCWIYNMAKSEWTDDVVVTFAKALAERN